MSSAIVHHAAETGTVFPQISELLRGIGSILMLGTLQPSVVNSVASETYLEAPILGIQIWEDVHIVCSSIIAAFFLEISAYLYGWLIFGVIHNIAI